MTRWPIRIALLVLLASVVALVFETRRMAAEVGDAERAAHQANERALLVEKQADEALLKKSDDPFGRRPKESAVRKYRTGGKGTKVESDSPEGASTSSSTSTQAAPGQSSSSGHL